MVIFTICSKFVLHRIFPKDRDEQFPKRRVKSFDLFYRSKARAKIVFYLTLSQISVTIYANINRYERHH